MTQCVYALGRDHHNRSTHLIPYIVHYIIGSIPGAILYIPEIYFITGSLYSLIPFPFFTWSPQSLFTSSAFLLTVTKSLLNSHSIGESNKFSHCYMQSELPFSFGVKDVQHWCQINTGSKLLITC